MVRPDWQTKAQWKSNYMYQVELFHSVSLMDMSSLLALLYLMKRHSERTGYEILNIYQYCNQVQFKIQQYIVHSTHNGRED